MFLSRCVNICGAPIDGWMDGMGAKKLFLFLRSDEFDSSSYCKIRLSWSSDWMII
jgi:hypothetical protein